MTEDSAVTGWREVPITKITYPSDVDFIHVVFHERGGAQIRPAGNEGDTCEGYPADVSAEEIAHLMGFAYRCGQVDLVRKLKEKAGKGKRDGAANVRRLLASYIVAAFWSITPLLCALFGATYLFYGITGIRKLLRLD